MSDPTESIRQGMVAHINAEPATREQLEEQHGRVWDTAEMQKEFAVLGFMAPLVVVKRIEDGVRGSLEFQHAPRFYYDFTEAQA